MSHTARGFASFFTRSTRESAPTAFSLTSSPTASGDRSNTTQLCPFLISRRTMLAPILPSPIIPSCISSPLLKNSFDSLRYLGHSVTQRFHCGRHAVVSAKYRRTCDQNVGSGRNCHWSRHLIHASVDFQLTIGVDLINHFCDPPNLGQSRLQKVLMSEARVHCHDQHLVEIRKNFFQNCSRGR